MMFDEDVRREETEKDKERESDQIPLCQLFQLFSSLKVSPFLPR